MRGTGAADETRGCTARFTKVRRPGQARKRTPVSNRNHHRAAPELVRRRFIGRALMHVYSGNVAQCHDLFDRLPEPLRLRASRAVLEKLAAHAAITRDPTWWVWAASVLPTPAAAAAGAELWNRLASGGG